MSEHPHFIYSSAVPDGEVPAQEVMTLDLLNRVAADLSWSRQIRGRPDWQVTPSITFPSSADSLAFVRAPNDAKRVEILMKAGVWLTELTKDMRKTIDSQRAQIEELTRQRDEARQAAGYSQDNSPALGGQKETT